jgi:hypothetical protein
VSFVFPLLLGGLAVVGVPILLHLIMRQKPKRLPFPAFRFLLQRHRTNLRKLRLRHLLLLALRVLLLALICLALARPRISGQGLNIGTDQPVAAVLVFDTRYTMGYTIEDSAGRKTLLDHARRKARELLAELPDESKVAVLDTARANKTWMSPDNARKHVDDLKLRPDNFTITDRLVDAYDMLDKLARDKDEGARRLPRFLYVFSNRTQSCWDARLVPKRQQDADRLPPPQERLQRLSEQVAPLIELLPALQDRLKVPGGSALAEVLQQLGGLAPSAEGPDYQESPANTLFPEARRQTRALIRQVRALGDRLSADSREYRDKLLEQLEGFLSAYRGAYEVFVDVGLDNPVDLAVESLELPRQIDSEAPRQVFAPGEQIPLRAMVRATGTAFDRQIDCLIDGQLVDSKAVKLKAGDSEPVAFLVDFGKLKLGKGLHQIEVRVKAQDALSFDDRRFATIEIREARPVLAIADSTDQADIWRKALAATGEFECEVQTPVTTVKGGIDELRKFKAVCLFGVVNPEPALWRLLKHYVDSGGGLAVIPPSEVKSKETSVKAYEATEAQELLPGRLKNVVKTDPKPGRVWSWEAGTYQTELLKPFRQWLPNPGIDFVKVPRRANRYWEVEPKPKKDADVLVRYADKPDHPAVLETIFEKKKGQGRVVLFTSSFDGGQGWNNYMETDSSFCVIMPYLTMRYLAGSSQSATWNFVSGQPVVVLLPLERQAPYTVEGPPLEDDAHSAIDLPPTVSSLPIRGAVRPGNYPIKDAKSKEDSPPIAAFSVNVLPAECDLTRVPEDQITSLFGPKSVVPVAADVKLLDALRDQWSPPLEMLPLFLVLLLLALVVESFFANKFYRREPDAPLEQPKLTT